MKSLKEIKAMTKADTATTASDLKIRQQKAHPKKQWHEFSKGQ